MEDARVLSIQSHVVSGYVGNKSAVFPMQLLGIEVDFINSVQFSNHTGYKSVTGQVLTEKELEDLVSGLSSNSIDFYTHLLTGYIGSPGFLNQICATIKQLKLKNPNLIYVCDPVIGDNGKAYVPKELIPIYRNVIAPLATIITPNLFELQLLTEMEIESFDDTWKGVEILHEKGCETVVVSSAEIGTAEKLYIFASSKRDGSTKLMMEINKLPVNFTGTGDLFASLFLSWMYKTDNTLKVSLENTVASLQAVLQRTYEGLQGKELTPESKELKLVQSKRDIEEPKIVYQAAVIE